MTAQASCLWPVPYAPQQSCVKIRAVCRYQTH